MPDKICIVITSYQPPLDLWQRCAKLRAQAAAVIVVDNTPGGIAEPVGEYGIELISDGINKGLGRALNIGIRKAIEMECSWLVLFDQDSKAPDGYCDRMLEEFTRVSAAVEQPLAALAPTFIDDETETRAQSLRERFGFGVAEDFVLSSALATSGLMVDVKSFHAVGQFNEEYFLDFVDFDWCWRARKIGYALARTHRVSVHHRLGLGQRTLFGFHYHVPADYRHYFQFRDTLFILFSSEAPLYDRLRLISLLPIKLLIHPILLGHGGTRLRWMAAGVRDFLLGRRAIGAAYKKIGTIQGP